MMVPEGAAVCGVDNVGAPDLLYISDYTATNPENSIGFFDGARDTGGLTQVTDPVSIALDTLVIEPGTPDPSYDTDGDGVNDSDFRVNGGVIVVDLLDLSRGSVCGVVTAVNLVTQTISVDLKSNVFASSPGTAELTAVPALEYRVDSVNARLYRNNLLLAEGVEDMQIAYFMDVNGNNAVDANEMRGVSGSNYVANASNASTLRSVRLNIVARTRSEDDNFTQGSFQATENRTPIDGQDGFRRRVHTATVRMRNVGDRVEGT